MALYDILALDIVLRGEHGGMKMELLPGYERQARYLLGRCKPAEAEQLLAPVVLSGCQYQLEAPGGLGEATAGFRNMIRAMRRLVKIKRLLGKEAEAAPGAGDG